MVAGDIEPNEGTIIRPGSVVYCPQTVDHLNSEIRDLAASWETDDFSLRGRLDLEPGDLERWTTLSPGERKRRQIGAALSADCDVPLLDEPTNHIDAPARTVLLDALERFSGVGLIVSHDRGVLNQLCSRTARIDHQTVQVWNGPYDTARVEWERSTAAAVDEHQRLRSEERRLRQRARQQRQSLEQGEAAARRAVRQAGTEDKDARSMEAKARRSAGAKAGAQRVTHTNARAERTGRDSEETALIKELGGSVFLDYEPARRPVVLSWDGPVQTPDHTLITNASVSVRRSDRIWLRRPNGSGKTTLMTAMLSATTIPADKILWLPQDQTGPERRALVQRVRDLDQVALGRVLNIVAGLGAEPDRFLVSEEPSPGEERKLTLAFGMGSHVVSRARRTYQPSRSSIDRAAADGLGRLPRCDLDGQP
jgi:ATPase subunit of ABC transporter with duplicated ATPase domains